MDTSYDYFILNLFTKSCTIMWLSFIFFTLTVKHEKSRKIPLTLWSLHSGCEFCQLAFDIPLSFVLSKIPRHHFSELLKLESQAQSK